MDAIAKHSREICFGLAWNWEYDQDFVHLLDRSCHAAGLSCYLVGPHNLPQTQLEVANGELRFRHFLDRASDNDDRFLEFNRLLVTKGTRFLNAHHHYARSVDKANIHYDLIACGVHVPHTVILPPHAEEPHFEARLLEPLTRPFVVKPARGGGGFGVVAGAMRPEEVTQARARYRNQRFLVQQRVEPQLIGGRRAWFRVYHVCGEAIPCWWDDTTHRYAVVTPADAAAVDTGELERVVGVVAGVCQLDFFSTEIALGRQGRYVVVDYVNDPCDMRLQSKHFDGVPDTVVGRIAAGIVGYLRQQIASPPVSTAEDAHLWP
jgi:hypothetical protein